MKFFKAIAVLPGTVLVLVPVFIISFSDFSIAPAGGAAMFIALGLFFAGLLIAAMSVMTLGGSGELKGRAGKLVREGLYARMRNPMLIGMILMLYGEAVYFSSVWIFVWAIIFTLVSHFYFKYVEEPKLETMYGDEYRQYKKNVSRWIPRVKAWNPKVSKANKS